MREASTDPQSVGIMGVFLSGLWAGLAGINSAEMSALCRVVSAPIEEMSTIGQVILKITN